MAKVSDFFKISIGLKVDAFIELLSRFKKWTFSKGKQQKLERFTTFTSESTIRVLKLHKNCLEY